MKKTIVFTDLDGTLLDYSTYSFEKAMPALSMLRLNNIPLILCSSKTRREIEFYRQKLDNMHPFISENGGGIFIPRDYFKFNISDTGFMPEETQKYLLIRLGALYSDLRITAAELQRAGFRIKGFGDMSVREIAETTRLSIEEAVMAKERDFDEPFLFDGDEREKTLLIHAIKSRDCNITQGRFYHLLGDSDKGKAVSIVMELYKKQFGEISTVALGDSPNDVQMLEKVDFPVVVQKPDGKYDANINISNIIKAAGTGPDGWNSAVIRILNSMSGL